MSSLGVRLRSGRTGQLARAMMRIRPPQRVTSRRRDAQDYWSSNKDATRVANAHLRGASAYSDDQWLAIGEFHRELLLSMLPVGESGPPWRRIVEWGCGGGANAIALAPLATEFVGVDLAPDLLDECTEQVGRVCDTRVEGVLTTVGDPWPAAQACREAGADLACCLYVLELVPDGRTGLEIVGALRHLLDPGGLAFVQIKYATRERRTASRRSNYRSNLANMTTYGIDEFWTACVDLGFAPLSVHLVPKNDLDERYAYFLLRKPAQEVAAFRSGE